VYEEDGDLSTRPKKYLYGKTNGNNAVLGGMTPLCIRFKREIQKGIWRKQVVPPVHIVVQHISVYGVEPG